MATQTEHVKTFTASEALEQYRRVKFTSGSRTAVEYADAGEAFCGITTERAASGAQVGVRQWGYWSTYLCIASEAISIAADLYGAADGKVSDTASGQKIAEAETATTADGQQIEARPMPGTVGGFDQLEDPGGNEVLILTATSSAVNEVTIANAATGNAPSIAASGDDANVGLDLQAKGTGTITLKDGSGNELLKTARVASALNEITISNAATGNKPIIAATGEADTGIEFHNDQAEELLILNAIATAVNEVTIANAATGGAPSVSATGGDTNISLDLKAKGTGWVINKVGASAVKRTQAAMTDTATITAATMRAGVIDGTPTAAATYTTPTAAELVAEVVGAEVGSSFLIFVNNKSGGANTITMAGGTGVTADGTLTVAQHVCRPFLVVLTNVTASSEAAILYGIG